MLTILIEVYGLDPAPFVLLCCQAGDAITIVACLDILVRSLRRTQ